MPVDNPAAQDGGAAIGPMRRAAASGGWLLAENMIRLSATALMSFWIARSLGPQAFGLLNFASALTAIVYALASLGLEVPAVLRLARGEAAESVLGTLLRLRLVAAGLGLLLAVAAAMWLRQGDGQAQTITLVVALSVVGYVPVVFDVVFKARVQAGPPAIARLLTTALSLSCKAAVLWLDLGLQALAWTVVLESAVASLTMWLAWRRHAGGAASGPLRYDPTTARALMAQSLPLLAAAMAVALLMKSDVVLLGYWAGDLAAGQYALAQKLSEVLYVVPLIVIDSVYPLWAARRVEAACEAGTQTLFDLAAAAGIVCALLGALAADRLIDRTFGAAYADSARLWQWHALSCIPVALDTARQRWLVARGEEGLALRFALIGAGVAIGLNVWLVPLHGAPAAAIVSVIAWLTCTLLAPACVPRLRPLTLALWRALWPWGRLFSALARQRRLA